MALNRELVGKSYAPFTFALDEEHVRRFAEAVGHPGDGVPPTLVTAPEIAAGLDNVIADPDLGLDFARVLHGDEEYEWRRPLRPGETLTAIATIESIRAKGSLELLTLRTELRDDSGEIAVLARSTLIVRDSA